MSPDPHSAPEFPLPEEPVRDGIGEEDHAIPAWFNVGFYGLILVGIAYLVYYVGSGWTAADQYRSEVDRLEAKYAAVRATQPQANPYHGDAPAIAEGQEVFTTICAACHLPTGQGLVGPSLVDPYWKYGHDDASLFASVSEGRPLGMPPWGPQLGAEKIWKVLAYVETLPKSDRPGVGAPDYTAPAPPGS